MRKGLNKCYLYLRVSKKKQTEGKGLERQQRDCMNWLDNKRSNQWVYGGVYQDKGVSAYKGDNLKGSLGRILTDIEKGVIKKGDLILSESVDRYSRQGIKLGTKLVNTITDKGVWIGCIKQGLLISPDDSGNDDELSNVINLVVALKLAHNESKAKSQRIRATIDLKIAQNIKHTNNIPFYLNYDAAANEYVFNEHAQTLLTCVELREKHNYGSQRMINYLKEHNITSPITKPLLERYLFSRSCKTIYGTYTHTRKDKGKVIRTEYPNYYPALISEERWLNLLNSRTPANSYGKNQQRNLFSQIILCPVCFNAMSYFKAARGLPKLRCKRVVSGDKDCSNPMPIHNYLPIEDTLIKVFKHLNFLPQNKGDSVVLSNRLRTEEQRLHKLKESLNTIDPDLIDVVITQMTECKNKITSLKLDLSNINVKALDNIPSDLTKIEHRTQFNSTLKQYVNSIVIYKSKYLISLKNNRLIVLYLDSEISPNGLNRILLGDGGIEFNLTQNNLDQALSVYEKYHKQKAREYLRKGDYTAKRFREALGKVYLD